MATLSITQAGFLLGESPGGGSGTPIGDLEISEAASGRLKVKSATDSEIKGFAVGASGESDFVKLIGNGGRSVMGLVANMGGGDDRLVIGKAKGDQAASTRQSSIDMGDGNDVFRNFGPFRNSSFEGGAGNDSAEFASSAKRAVVGSTIDMGDGDDTLVFGGTVKDSSISLGTGADTATFEGNINNVTLDLGGPDGATDVVNIAGGASISGLQITGAEEGDVLIIGSSEYSFAGGDTWVNDIDSSDIRNF